MTLIYRKSYRYANFLYLKPNIKQRLKKSRDYLNNLSSQQYSYIQIAFILGTIFTCFSFVPLFHKKYYRYSNILYFNPKIKKMFQKSSDFLYNFSPVTLFHQKKNIYIHCKNPKDFYIPLRYFLLNESKILFHTMNYDKLWQFKIDLIR